MRLSRTVMLCGAVLLASAAYAQGEEETDASLSKTRVEVNNDPSQVVCIRDHRTGARIAQRRVCRTRAEWAQLRSETRQTVERIQTYEPYGS